MQTRAARTGRILDANGRPFPIEQRQLPQRDRAGDGERWTVRRWAAADTNRLNQSHWQNAAGQSINTDLQNDLETLCARVALETYNNPLLDGMVSSYATDLVGPRGPTLQVLSDNDAYNDALQNLWAELWERLEFTGRLDGTELLRQWVRMWFLRGEWLATPRSVDDDFPITLRLETLHPERLQTPPEQMGNQYCTLGVEVDDDLRALRYWLQRPEQLGPAINYDAYPAAEILHDFIQVEPGQVRGYPWLASSLQAAGDMRDYDDQVLDAARSAADLAVLLTNDHPEAPYFPLNESTQIERRTISTMPPGWKASIVEGNQPQNNYCDYRKERQMEIGRPVNMPLMMIRLSSENHNFSSARFDSQVYHRGLESNRGRIEGKLRPIAREMAREAKLEARSSDGRLDRVLADPPARVQYIFCWDDAPHVDPEKEADAAGKRLETLVSTLGDELPPGVTFDTHLKRLKVEFEKIKKAGLLPLLLAGRLANVMASEITGESPPERTPQPDDGVPANAR